MLTLAKRNRSESKVASPSSSRRLISSAVKESAGIDRRRNGLKKKHTHTAHTSKKIKDASAASNVMRPSLLMVPSAVCNTRPNARHEVTILQRARYQG